MTASAEEMCDHLMNVWIARHGCPITFQSGNCKASVGDLTKELMKKSQNGLVERQNSTLVSMLRVYCSRYMDDWDRHLPQVMGATPALRFHHGNKSAYDANWSRKGAFVDVLLPRV